MAEVELSGPMPEPLSQEELERMGDLAGKTVLIQFCGAGDKYGGVQNAANMLGELVVDNGGEAHISVGSAHDEEAVKEVMPAFGDNVHILGKGKRKFQINGAENPLPGWMSYKKARNLVSEVNPDLLHIMAPWQPFVGERVLRRAQIEGIPTIATYHIDSDKFLTNLGLTIMGDAYKHRIYDLTVMIAVSEQAQEHAMNRFGYKRKPIRIIPNGVDVRELEKAKPYEVDEPFKGYRSKPNAQTIVFVGRPDERKGLDTLIEAAAKLDTTRVYYDIIICGGGDKLNEYKQLAKASGVGERIHFRGEVSEEEKLRWLASADFAVFPAKTGESQGIVLLEAMAAGSGVVLGGANEGYKGVLGQLKEHESALFDPYEPELLAERIMELHTDTDTARKIHVEQQELIRKHYDTRVVGRQILSVYKEALVGF